MEEIGTSPRDLPASKCSSFDLISRIPVASPLTPCMPTTWRTWRVPSEVSCAFCAETSGTPSITSRAKIVIRVFVGMVGRVVAVGCIELYTGGRYSRKMTVQLVTKYERLWRHWELGTGRSRTRPFEICTSSANHCYLGGCCDSAAFFSRANSSATFLRRASSSIWSCLSIVAVELLKLF